MKKKITHRITHTSILPIILFGLIYCLFPSHNNSNDAYMYAGDVLLGEDLFYAHHLLFNATGFLFKTLLGVENTLGLLCLINALAATLCLIILRSILSRLTTEKQTTTLIYLVGSCWSICRFSCEAETYIIPIVFSLLSSLLLLKGKNPLLVSISAAAACLFHQIHFFWWLGLGIGILSLKTDRTRNFLLYIVGGFIVPICYYLTHLFIPDAPTNFFHFIFHDYIYSESVGFCFRDALILTPINLIRTCIQAHGYIPSLIKNYPIFAVGIAMSIVCILLSIRKLKGLRLIFGTPKTEKNRPFAMTHVWIIILQIVFAFLSNGNAEFMVMLPFAMGIVLASYRLFPEKRLLWLGTGILLWNLSVGTIPYNQIEIFPHKAIARHIEQHPDTPYVLMDHAIMYNLLRYQFPKNLHQLSDSVPESGCFYTDRNQNMLFLSRASIQSSNGNTDIEQNLHILAEDTLQYDLGVWYLLKTEPKIGSDF